MKTYSSHPLQGKTVLVTGATGFLGGALVACLSQFDVTIRALVRRPNRDNYIKALPNVTQVQGDLSQPHTLQDAVKGCDIVFHTAVSYGNLAEQTRINAEGTRDLAQVCADNHITRLVHVSTLASYGYKVRGKVTEDTPLVPSNEPYSLTKANAEAHLKAVAHQNALSYAIVRAGGIYGARSGMWTDRMFSVAKRKPLIFVGSGQGNAPLIHIDDLVDLLVLVATHPNAHNQAFHAVLPTSHTWREFLGAYAQLVNNDTWIGVPFGIVKFFASLISALAPTPSPAKTLAEVLEYANSAVTYDMNKAKNLLQWQPSLTLQEGIKRCEPYLKERGLL